MPGYQRFVTYMFRYKDEKKQENCGFAKIEIRQGPLPGADSDYGNEGERSGSLFPV